MGFGNLHIRFLQIVRNQLPRKRFNVRDVSDASSFHLSQTLPFPPLTPAIIPTFLIGDRKTAVAVIRSAEVWRNAEVN